MYLISRRERAKEKPSRTGTNIRHIWRLRTPSKTKPKRKASAGDSHARIAQRRYIAAVENFLDQHGLDIRIRPILRQRFHKINAIHFRIRQLAEFRYFGIVQHPKVSSPMGFTLFLPVTAYMQMGCSVYFNAPVSSKSSRPAALGSSSPCSLCPPGNSSVSLSLYAYTGSICRDIWPQSRQIEHIRRERFHRTLQILHSWSCSVLSYPVVFSLIEDKIIY